MIKTLSLEEILNNYKEYLTAREIDGLRALQNSQNDFQSQAEEIRRTLFSEEWDFKNEENPSYQQDTDIANRKRIAFGVSPVSINGETRDDSSRKFAEEVVRQTKNYSEYLSHKENKTKQVVYVDMDSVLVNFKSGIDKISKDDFTKYGPDDFDEVPGIFSLMEPIEDAIEAYEWLNENFDTYILSTAPWGNPSAWTDKLLWVKKYLPQAAYKRLILSHHKNLLKGDFIIDDREVRGVDKFQGKHIHFSEKGKGFESWKKVMIYMKNLV